MEFVFTQKTVYACVVVVLVPCKKKFSSGPKHGVFLGAIIASAHLIFSKCFSLRKLHQIVFIKRYVYTSNIVIFSFFKLFCKVPKINVKKEPPLFSKVIKP